MCLLSWLSCDLKYLLKVFTVKEDLVYLPIKTNAYLNKYEYGVQLLKKKY